ncbi:MAG TPA: prenyltransferase [Polyangiaceae bacterium]
MTRLRVWVQASRPLAQIAIAVPLIYGQALAYAVHGTFRWRLFLLVQLFGVFDCLMVVFGNDAVDWRADVRNTTFNRFSGGSRVVPLGLLTPFALAQASLLSLLGLGATSVFFVFREGHAWMVVLAAISAHIFWVYGFPPFRLSYRGGGEVLQGLGMGLVLPVVGFYGQANTLEGLRAATLFPAFLLGVAGHITTSLPDTPSDAEAGKRTFPVCRGESAARHTSLALIAIAALATPLAVLGKGVGGFIAVAIGALLVLTRNLGLASRADATDRPSCERFVARNLGAIHLVLLGWAAVAVLASIR